MVIKILSVDDEPDLEVLIRQKFRRKIRNGEYDFVFARNGVEALQVLDEHKDVAFILSDINMPEMDGLTLLDRVKELKRPSLKTVMVTAYGDMANLRTAMNRGAFDFVNKPINFDDLDITIAKTLEQVEQVNLSLRERDQLVSIQQDLNVAKNIQHSLVPSKFPAFPNRTEFDIFATMDAAKDVGGDLYDFFKIDDEKIGFVLGDVAGKGIPGAIFMALSRTIIRTTALKNIPTKDCMFESNNMICMESIDSMFVTLFYGILNTKTGEVHYTNAGHCSPYKLKTDGTIEKLPVTRNMALGVMEDLPYSTKTTKLEKGESIFVFSDGVTEAMNPIDKIYTDEKLENFLLNKNSHTPKEVCQTVVADVKLHANGAEQSDDITTLCIKYLG